MKQLLLTWFFVLSLSISATANHSLLHRILEPNFAGKNEARNPTTSGSAVRQDTIQPIPFADEDGDPIHSKLAESAVFGQYYAAVEVLVQNATYFPSRCQQNAGWKFLHFLGVSRDGQYTITAKITNGSVATETVPLFSVKKTGNNCEVTTTKGIGQSGVQISPYFLLDAERKLQATVEIRYKSNLEVDLVKRWFDVFYNVAATSVNIAGISLNTKGITLKENAVLSKDEYDKIADRINQVDAQLDNIFGRIIESDKKLTVTFSLPVERVKGVWMRTGLGPPINAIVGWRAANMALVIKPRISLLLPNRLIKTEKVKGANYLLPDLGSVGSSPTTQNFFYNASDRELVSYNTLSKKTDDALIEISKRLPKSGEDDLEKWRSACSSIFNHVRSTYGLNDYDALAIANALFLETGLAKSHRFSDVGCSSALIISSIWPKVGFAEPDIEKEDDEFAACWNTHRKRADVRRFVDQRVTSVLGRQFGPRQEDAKKTFRERIDRLSADALELDDPHGVLTLDGEESWSLKRNAILDRLADWETTERGACYGSTRTLESPYYDRGFLTADGTGGVEIRYEFENLCDSFDRGATPKISRITVIRLVDDGDETSAETVERLLNAGTSCHICRPLIDKVLNQTLARFRAIDTCI